MGPFSLEARSQCNILQEMFKKMETLYTGLESYYVFDKQKYTLEEFMSDIKKFKDQFKVSSYIQEYGVFKIRLRKARTERGYCTENK